MANPAPATVTPATAPKAGAAPQTTPTTTTTVAPTTTPTPTTTVAPQDAPKAEGEDTDASDSFRVLKAFTLDDGMTIMPGEKFSPGDVEKWPARRTKQLVEQKYLRPIG